MTLDVGSRLGPYEVLGPLGAGGMGEVYKARDPRLGRDVAVKVLPASFSADPDRLRRFEQEARAAAALNHPNILAIYDIGSHNDAPYIVSELLEGHTLRHSLRRGSLSVKKAAHYAIQIANGLAAAHEKGILHRDLKPENIFISPEGRAKILDFGLAKLTEHRKFDGGATSTTLPVDTDAGLAFGTVGYMSPEQVRREAVDRGTDIFSFGAVLYEMLSGARAFQGSSTIEMLNAILKDDPPALTASHAEIPPALDQVVHHCLEKEPAQRFRGASDLAFAIQMAATSGSLVSRPVSQVWFWAAATLGIACLLLLVLVGRRSLGRPSAFDEPVSRFVIDPPKSVRFREVVVSPDSRLIAIVGSANNNDVTHLWLRHLDDPTLELVGGVDNPSSPFWSPDSQEVAFFSNGHLETFAVGSHVTKDLTPVHAKSIRPRPGGTWNRTGTILYTDDDETIRSVSAEGGTSKPLLPEGIPSQLWPSFLADGRHFVFTRDGRTEDSGIFLGSLESPTITRITSDVSRVSVVPPNRLLFVRGTALQLQALDVNAGVLIGRSVRMAESFPHDRYGAMGYPAFSGSANVLAYYAQALTRLEWVDRDGKPLGSITSPVNDAHPSLSPDGHRVTFERRDPESHISSIWIADLSTDKTSQLTFPPSSATDPIWSPDGEQIAFKKFSSGSDPAGATVSIVTKHADGLGQERELLSTSRTATSASLLPCDWSPDGQFLLYSDEKGLSLLPTASVGAPTGLREKMLVPTLTMLPTFSPVNPPKPYTFLVGCGAISPDARHVAYVGALSGNVHVRRLSDGADTIVQNDGPVDGPKWRGDGKEVYFISHGDTAIKAVGFDPDKMSATGQPSTLFKLEGFLLIEGNRRTDIVPSEGADSYAVARDGQRFIVRRSLREQESDPITVVSNWAATIGK